MITQPELDLLAADMRAARDQMDVRRAQSEVLAAEAGAVADLAALMVARLQRDCTDLDQLAARIAILDPRGQPPPPPAFGWVGTREGPFGRGYHVGCMSVSGNALANWRTAMGGHAPEIVVANVGAQGFVDTMDKVCGGPLGSPASVIHPGTAWSLDRSYQATDVWNKTNGVTRDTWFVVCSTLAPYGCGLDLIQAIGRGEYRDHFRLAGERQAYQLTTCAHRLDRYLYRLIHEHDQDTGLSVVSYNAAGARQTGFWQACFNAGMTLDEAIQLFADFTGEAVGAMREGFGLHVPFVYSPALEGIKVPREWNNGQLPYARMLELHNGACVSVHWDYWRLASDAATRDMIASTATRFNTLAVALEAAKAQGKPVMTLECSPRHEPPPATYVTPERDLSRLPVGVGQFLDFVEANRPHMFAVCLMGSPVINEDYLLNLTYPAGHVQAGQKVYVDPTHRNVLAWRQSAALFKSRLGRGAAIVRASASSPTRI